MFTFDNLKTGLRAKGELCRNKNLLGDKRTEVTLLLDENFVLKNKDLSHTEKQFGGGESTAIRQPFKTSEERQFSDKPEFDKGQQFNRPQFDKPPQYERPSF
jgi:hypothetical protein